MLFVGFHHLCITSRRYNNPCVVLAALETSKRIVGPFDTTVRLAKIAYECNLRKLTTNQNQTVFRRYGNKGSTQTQQMESNMNILCDNNNRNEW
jgi:hypothetical protein